MKNELDDINRIWAEIEDNLILLQKKSPGLEPFIQAFIKALNGVVVNLQRVQESLLKRQYLIDYQCNHLIFDGQVHEEYHDVTNLLDIDFDTYLFSIKTALNRLPPIIVRALPHSERGGLKDRSFGVFVNSMNGEDVPMQLIELKNIVINQGKKIDKTIHEYRDKYIEHIRNPSMEKGLITDKKGIRRYHNIGPSNRNLISNSEEYIKYIKTLPKEMNGQAVRVVHRDGGYMFYVHLKGIKGSGVPINAGDFLGVISDGGSGHFEVYGPHSHVFSHPKVLLDELVKDSLFSPSTYESIRKVGHFIESVTTLLAKGTFK